MSEEEIRQDLLDIRYFAERMLQGLYNNDQRAQADTMYELAKLVAITYHLSPVAIFQTLIAIWNGSTIDLRSRTVSGDETRQTVFRIIGEIFAKYGLPDPGYEEDEL